MGRSLLDRVELDDLDNAPAEAEAEPLDRDPAPAESARKRRRRKVTEAVRPSGRTVTTTTRKRIAAELQAYIELAAIPVIVRDPICGDAIHAQAEPCAEAIAGILGRYPDLADKFLATGLIGDWIKLAMAIKPIFETVWAHHVTKTIGAEGGPDEPPRDANGYSGRIATLPAFRAAG